MSRLFILLFCALTACAGSRLPSADDLRVTSPDVRTVVTVDLTDGALTYAVARDGQPLVQPSVLGVTFADGAALFGNLSIVEAETNAHDATWETVWGEFAEIRDRHNALRVLVAEPSGRRMWVAFRVFDDGLGFRYEWPEQPGLSDFAITDEKTEFALAHDGTAWWIPAYRDNRYEYLYEADPVAALDTVHTPLTIVNPDGTHLALHEAALTDFASMTLENTGGTTLKANLVPWPDGIKVKARTPHVSPWRTLQISDNAAGLATSTLVLNLNEPNRIENTTWIEPGKYVGIWWEMHLGTSSWGSGDIHGATTENAKRYIDFAAANGFEGVLIEGWNVGWDGNWFDNGTAFDFTRPYPDFDIKEVARYGAERGVRIVGHHETGAGIDNYEAQMEDAFAYYENLGVKAVKTGYVGIRTYGGGETHWHHGQYMVNHYRRAVETAAEYHIVLDVHEPIKATGIRRTWPNMMTREGARGQEYNAWSGDGGNPPEHETILPFTRMLGGPFDFTPGIFDLFFPQANRPDNRVNTTIAKQLALYVVLYSPLHMAADLPENYDHPAFQFIRDVPTDWADTRVLAAEIGEHVTFVRKDRRSDAWYLGSVTDEQARAFTFALDFLEAGRTYTAQLYTDAGDWLNDPTGVSVTERDVTAADTLTLELGAGGGAAVRFVAR